MGGDGKKRAVETADRTAEIDGLEIHWLEAGDAAVLYLHGVPTGASDWVPFLERTGGFAPDLPGFGRSAKPADFPYSLAAYDRFVERFCDVVGLDRVSLVMHDWGGAGLAFAQRFPERVERIVLFASLPLLPGFRWHRIARAWRLPLVGELTMGFTTRAALRRTIPSEVVDRIWPDFDHGTQRAILKLYRATPESQLAAAGARLGEVRAPALIVWPEKDPFIDASFGRAYADALGGEVTLEMVDTGHWSWVERPEVVDRVTRFLG
jgi:pimeloyl-ACP methyl ester carboxylesterase